MRMKFIFIIVSLLLIQNSSARIIFNGTFNSGDSLQFPLGQSPNNNQAITFGTAYQGWFCIPRSDSLNIVSADGGRSGYMARFIIRQDAANSYYCAGDHHDQLEFHAYPDGDTPHENSIPRGNNTRNIWYGWSEKLGSDFTCPTTANGGTGTTIGFSGGTSKFKGGTYGNAGLGRQMWANCRIVLISNYPENGYYPSALYPSIKSGEFSSTTNLYPNYEKNVWYDWMYHVNWGNNVTMNGSLEVFVRKEGEVNYTKIWSRYNYATEYLGYTGATSSNNVIAPRVGMYRTYAPNDNPSSLLYNVSMYIYNPKIATTRAEVEHNSTGDSGEEPVYTAPIITSWSNSKTNDASQDITINVGEFVNFTVTANQTMGYWNWFLDSVQLS